MYIIYILYIYIYYIYYILYVSEWIRSSLFSSWYIIADGINLGKRVISELLKI